ncbi:hypothetical protein PHLCEN_2v4381 [Hermanssonia centrifuga]|uniref:Uncharacterized protein n=1 Tax=Hermanssonia centrifuga TaxID=98765 RepID=A0A2R6PW79_9APHY|nr:hypothetical protein PHLCEN_2v4381 [Hermanssonia centrifuga]
MLVTTVLPNTNSNEIPDRWDILMKSTLSPESYLLYPVQFWEDSRIRLTRSSQHQEKDADTDAILVQTEPQPFKITWSWS